MSSFRKFRRKFRSVDKYGIIEYKNEKELLHNEDGPAVIYTDGHVEYWINGEYYSIKENWKNEILRLRLQRIKDL